nr:MFS transporter [Bacillus subtilis]
MKRGAGWSVWYRSACRASINRHRVHARIAKMAREARYREEEARRIMNITHDPKDIEMELAEMKQGEAEKKETTLGVLKAKWIRPMLLIGVGLAIFQQAVGINTVIYYAPTIFTKAGLGTSASALGTMGIGVLNVIMCITAMILIDRVGTAKNF